MNIAATMTTDTGAPDRLGLDRLIAEQRIVFACCRPVGAPGRIEAIRAAASDPFDAARLLSVTIAHRVEGFVEQGLAAAGIVLPPAAQETLARRAGNGRRGMLLHTAETIRLSKLFAATEIDAIFLKGAALAMVAHGSFSQKTSSDIDILVDPRSLERLFSALPGWGYHFTCVLDVEGDRLIHRYATLNSETTWRSPERRMTLDVHQRLMFHKTLMPGVGLASPREAVALSPAQSVTTIARDHLFAYLTVHGLGHGWERIKWLADVVAMLGDDPTEIERLHGVARSLGAGRSVDVALILCAKLLGAPVPAALLDRLMADRINCFLGRLSISMIGCTEDLDREFRRPMADQIGHLLVPYLSAMRWRDRLGMAWSEISRPRSVMQLRVPLPILPLFSLVWVPLFLAARPLWLLAKRQRQGNNRLASP